MSMEIPLVDLFRELMSRVAAAVSVLTLVDGEGVRRGMTVSTLTSVTADPPSVLVCVGPQAPSRPAMVPGRRFCANVLASDQVPLSVAFAWGEQDPFTLFDWESGDDGVPILGGTAAHILCEVEQVVDFHDTSLVLARVLGGGVSKDEALIYWRRRYYRELGGTDTEIVGKW